MPSAPIALLHYLVVVIKEQIDIFCLSTDKATNSSLSLFWSAFDLAFVCNVIYKNELSVFLYQLSLLFCCANKLLTSSSHSSSGNNSIEYLQRESFQISRLLDSSTIEKGFLNWSNSLSLAFPSSRTLFRSNGKIKSSIRCNHLWSNWVLITNPSLLSLPSDFLPFACWLIFFLSKLY